MLRRLFFDAWDNVTSFASSRTSIGSCFTVVVAAEFSSACPNILLNWRRVSSNGSLRLYVPQSDSYLILQFDNAPVLAMTVGLVMVR